MKYYLKYKNEPTLEFDNEQYRVKVINRSLIPLSIRSLGETYDMVKQFCSTRILTSNRVHYKELLTSYNIDDQSDISIALASKALSFRDNYWISEISSNETWEQVNLYDNEFSAEMPAIGLTGNTASRDANSRFNM